jgi:hypothetical protein
MNPQPTLTEIIESAIRSVSRIEAILDRMEAREAVMEAALVELPEPALPSAPTVTDAPEDPTHRDLPMPADCPPLPPLPAGMTRWVNRGSFRVGELVLIGDRVVRYYSPSSNDWIQTGSFSSDLIHIEAVNESPVAPTAPVAPKAIPEVGGFYWLKNKFTARINSYDGRHYVGEINIDDQWHSYHWRPDGTSCTGNSQFDLAEPCPF